MKTYYGTLFMYDQEGSTGIVQGNDKKYYTFSRTQWEGRYPPIHEEAVVFLLDEQQEITRVQSLESYEEKKQRQEAIKTQKVHIAKKQQNTKKPHKTGIIARYHEWINTIEQKTAKTLFDLFLLSVFTKTTQFSGRASRREFFAFFIITLPFNLTAALLTLQQTSFAFSGLGLLYMLVMLVEYVLFVPNLSLIFRRLHDRNLPGIFSMIGLFPPIAPVLIVILFLKGKPGKNKYGEEPKY